MANGLRNLLQDPWGDSDLFAESIPHLLHWDLAFLHVLQLDSDLRPKGWGFRIEAWKRLLYLFLLGELKIERLRLEEPLSRYTRKLGINNVSLLKLNNRYVGVLSYTVLVRPLPDCTSEEADSLPDLRMSRPAEIAKALEDLTKQLDGGEIPQIRGQLREFIGVLREQLGDVLPAEQLNSELEPVQLLTKIGWDRSDDLFEELEIPVASGIGPVYVPRCTVCNELLTRTDSEQLQIEIGAGQSLALDCPNGHRQELDLEKLMIWVRRQEAVVWTDRDPESLECYLPPPPRVLGNEVIFEWNPGQLNMENTRRFLTLIFPHRKLVKMKRDDIFFDKILVPGESMKRFQGLLIRPEWIDALESVEIEANENSVTYRQLKIRGVPFKFNRKLGSLQICREPGLAFGVYPRPLYSRWKRYRLFIAGENSPSYKITTPTAFPGLEQVAQIENGWPRVASLSNEDGMIGASWILKSDSPAEVAGGGSSIVLGVDFGTTTSLVYFQTQQDQSDLRETHNALNPADLSRMIHWVQGEMPDGTAIGWLFPGDLEGTGDRDPYLIPSAIWRLPESPFTPIRWGPESPSDSARPLKGFKWDEGAGGSRNERLKYLEELLFLAIPFALNRLELSQHGAVLNLGFAYPLAFNYTQRNDFKTTLNDLSRIVGEFAGVDTNIFSINESLASIKAWGEADRGEMFLVADQGGGTIDVALFEFQQEMQHRGKEHSLRQIGSIAFGGEVYLESLVAQMQENVEKRPQLYWEVRDAISSQEVAIRFPQNLQMRRLLNRFQPLTLEILRIMLKAYRKNDPETKIRILLMGNGWRLRELAQLGVSPPQAVFEDYYGEAVRILDCGNVCLDENCLNPIVSKHFVARGALANAKAQNHELREETSYASKFPAGSRIVFQPENTNETVTIEWFDLVGEGSSHLGYPDSSLSRGSIEFETAPPELSDQWKVRLAEAMPPNGELYPSKDALRQKVTRAINNGRLQKGPLQIVAETHWKQALGD